VILHAGHPIKIAPMNPHALPAAVDADGLIALKYLILYIVAAINIQKIIANKR